MQQGQPNARLSIDDHTLTNPMYRQETPSSYAQGFSAGFEAGRRTSLGEGTTAHRITGSNGQRLSAGTHPSPSPTNIRDNRTKTFSHRQMPSHPPTDRTNHFDSHSPGGNARRLSGGFQTRQSIDGQMRITQQDHDTNGQISTPDTTVQFNARGHY